MSESALQLCEIAMGDPVLIKSKDNLVVKTAWPMNDKSLTTVFLTKSGNFSLLLFLDIFLKISDTN